MGVEPRMCGGFFQGQPRRQRNSSPLVPHFFSSSTPIRRAQSGDWSSWGSETCSPYNEGRAGWAGEMEEQKVIEAPCCWSHREQS